MPSDSFHDYYSSLMKQNIHVFLALGWGRSCRYRAGTDQINALQAKIRLSLTKERFQLYFGTFCMLGFCPVGCFSVLRQHLLWRTNSTPHLSGVFQLLAFGSNWCSSTGSRAQALPEGSELSYPCCWVFPGLFWAPWLSVLLQSFSKLWKSHPGISRLFRVTPELPV